METLRRAVEAVRLDAPRLGPWRREEGFAGPPQLHAAVDAVAAPFDPRPGRKPLKNSTLTYTVLDGDMMGGHVGFKYVGYGEDVAELGGYWSAHSGMSEPTMRALETD